MKGTLLLLCVTAVGSAYAQKVSISKDTIYNGTRPVALIAERKGIPVRYHISSLGGNLLIRISDARMDLNDKPAYVITFPDKRKAMLAVAKTPGELVTEIVDAHVITRVGAIDPLAENIFVKNHPLPDGFTDVDRPMEPGRRIRTPKK